MKNTFAKKFTVCALAWVLGVAFTACGDDDSSSPKGTGLPAEVADKAELETYECSMDVIGEKVYVADLELNYECDGEKWFKSYDQTKPSSTSAKSSSSKKTDGSSDSKTADRDGSSSNDKGEATSSSSALYVPLSFGATEPTWGLLNPDIEYGELVDERDGKIYKTVQIGTQTWMAQNLAFDPDLKDEKGNKRDFCRMGSGCDTIGYHYPWSVSVDTMGLYGSASFYAGIRKSSNEWFKHHMRGICPEGWHVPHSDEFKTLIEFVGGADVAGKHLKAKTGWEKVDGNVDPNGLDTYGFSVLPSGRPDRGGGKYVWAQIGAYDGEFNWTRFFMEFNSVEASVELDDDGLYLSMVIRCVKDLKAIPYSKDPVPACNENGVDNCEYGELVDERDGKKYKTVAIGKQIWMAENLNYNSNYRDENSGDSIVNSWCVAYGVGCTFGRYYSWSAVMDSSGMASGKPSGCGMNAPCLEEGRVQGICPVGWHLPDTTEINELINYIHYVGKKYASGQALKIYSRSNISWRESPEDAVDAYGFGAMPMGKGQLDSLGKLKNDGFSTIVYSCSNCSDFKGGEALFWSHWHDSETRPYVFSLLEKRHSLVSYKSDAYNVSTVRCIKDSE